MQISALLLLALTVTELALLFVVIAFYLRLLAAAEILLGEHPGWGTAGVRFDLLVVDATGTVRRIADAFRAEE